MSEAEKPNDTPLTERQKKQIISAATEYGSRLLVASVLTAWGVLNFVNGVRPLWFPSTEEGGPWWITALFLLATAVVPLAIGLNQFRKLFR